MGIKAALSKPFAFFVSIQIGKMRRNAVGYQDQIFKKLIKSAAHTSFGRDHHFDQIKTYEDFKRLVPVRDYEDLKPYINRVTAGEENVLWPGKPVYLAKTSGTTSGVKYIPISKESMPEHIRAARNALLNYIAETGNASFTDGKMIFLQGSPDLQEKAGIKVGRLSGIVAHHVPDYLLQNRMPGDAVNRIEDWEQKIDAIVAETVDQDMTLISGIPPWCQMYFNRLSEKTGGKKIRDIFPNFSLFIYGGVNYAPYRAKIEQTIGFAIPSIETYPASEGFIAYQNSQKSNELLLLSDAGIFFEFIPVETYFDGKPVRLSLKEVKINQNYAIILNTNAGLWAYNLGDTVKFTSVNPYMIVVTGRIKHFISAFGEHVIGEEVEQALMEVCKAENIGIVEFTVAPQVNPANNELPYHEWFIEFAAAPADLSVFSKKVDEKLQQKNIYYADLIHGKILKPLVIRSLKPNSFIELMRKSGKLGGQNKVPRLANNRTIAAGLESYILI